MGGMVHISFQVVYCPDEQGGGSGGDSPPKMKNKYILFLGVSSEAEDSTDGEVVLPGRVGG